MTRAASPTETAALIALLRLARRPPHVYSELIEQAGSATAVLTEELHAPRTEPTGQTALELSPQPEDILNQATCDLERWQASGIQILTVLDPDYPDNLRAVHDRPPLIFVSGRLTEADQRAVAVIGSRRASLSGLAAATEISAHLAAAGYTIVSGLAAGIDTAAHEAALQTPAGRTIAVIGTGLNRAYPPQNEPLQRRISASGAVVSQFPPHAPPSRTAFPLRNAAMSGLSLATVVVEASEASGARIQARRALAHGRGVLLCRPVLARSWASQLSRRPGVTVVNGPGQIHRLLEALPAHPPIVA